MDSMMDVGEHELLCNYFILFCVISSKLECVFVLYG